MTQEKYQPTPAPLGANALPEYVLRELRRVGNVINTGFENLEASLSAVAAAAIQVSASAGMRVYSATAGVVVLELDGSNLTSRSSSQTELYYLAWDASASHAFRVPGDAMPGAGGGGGGASTLDGLTDVSFSASPVAGDILIYDGASWVRGIPTREPSVIKVSDANASDDYFHYGSSLDTSGARFSGAKAWSWRNKNGTLTDSVSRQRLVLYSTGSEANLNCAEISISASASSWRYEARINHKSTFYQIIVGMYVADSSTGRILTHTRTWQSTGYKYEAQRWTTYSAFSSAPKASAWDANIGTVTAPVVFSIAFDGTTYTLDYGNTGGENGNLYNIWSETAATFVATPDRIGIVFRQNYAGAGWMTVDYFRKIA